MELSDEVRHQIRESLKPLHPEKVIVYTSPEWKCFQDSGSAFAREIISRGQDLS